MKLRSASLLLLAFLGHAACDRTIAPPREATSSPPPSTTAAPAETKSEIAPPAASDAPSATPSAPAAPDTSFADLVNKLSEPDQHFFSDNYISNETSYLHVADGLAKSTTAGGAYIGVGPEQNFTYIALTRPKIAFIVDIRRENMVLHLLYKAIFQRASSRSHFLALLVGRPHDAASEPGESATIEQKLTFEGDATVELELED